METAKIFMSGRSQAVRLPKKYRFNHDEVMIQPFGKGILLLPIENPWSLMQEAIEEFDTPLIRGDQSVVVREEII